MLPGRLQVSERVFVILGHQLSTIVEDRGSEDRKPTSMATIGALHTVHRVPPMISAAFGLEYLVLFRCK